MNAPALVAALSGRGVVLFLDDGKLRFRGPAGAMTEADRAALRDDRDSVTAYLAARAAAVPPVAIAPADPQALVASMYQEVWWRLVRPSAQQLRMERVPLVLALVEATPADAEAALRAVVARHQTLRTRFHETDAGLVAALNPPEDFAVAVEAVPDMAALPGRIAAFFGQPLRVDGAWLCAALIFDVADGPTVIVMVAHHIVFDGTSIGLVAEDIKRHLSGAPFEDEPVQFPDYAAWERDWFASGAAAPLIAWWRNWLANLPRLTAPGCGDLTWTPGERVDHPLPLSAAHSALLVRVAARMKTTPFLVILAVFGLALARWSGQPRFPIRAIGDLRTTPLVGRTVGLMICADPLEVDAPEGGDFAALVRHMAADYARALSLRLPSHPAGTGAGYAELHERIAATINYVPAGALRAATPQPWETERAREAPWPLPPNLAQTLPWPVPLPTIFLRLWEAPDGLTGRLEFNGAVLDADQQAAMVAAFLAAVEVAAGSA